jgi:hypothetical protein
MAVRVRAEDNALVVDDDQSQPVGPEPASWLGHQTCGMDLTRAIPALLTAVGTLERCGGRGDAGMYALHGPESVSSAEGARQA